MSESNQADRGIGLRDRKIDRRPERICDRGHRVIRMSPLGQARHLKPSPQVHQEFIADVKKVRETRKALSIYTMEQLNLPIKNHESEDHL